MPSELRKVVFSKDEVWKAVVSHCMRAAIHMPNAPLEDVVVPSNFEPAVEMHIVLGPETLHERKCLVGSCAALTHRDAASFKLFCKLTTHANTEMKATV